MYGTNENDTQIHSKVENAEYLRSGMRISKTVSLIVTLNVSLNMSLNVSLSVSLNDKHRIII